MRAMRLGLFVAIGLVWSASGLLAEEYQDAKIVKIGEKLLVTFEVGGKQVQVTAYPFLKGFGTDGKPLTELGHGVRVLKEGNILDLKTESMKLTGQPQMYISEARLKKGELQTLEVLRSIATPNVPGKKSREPEAGTVFTVVKAEPRRAVVLRGADGKQVSAIPSLDKATDAAGQPLPDDQLQRVMKVGNVLEVKLGKVSNSQQQTIKEARLVSGELVPLAPSTPAAPIDVKEYRGVVLKKFGIRGSAIEVDGKEIAIGNWNPKSVFFDVKGQQVKSGPDILAAVKAGSIVDIKLGPQPPKGSGATLLEIKVIRVP